MLVPSYAGLEGVDHLYLFGSTAPPAKAHRLTRRIWYRYARADRGLDIARVRNKV